MIVGLKERSKLLTALLLRDGSLDCKRNGNAPQGEESPRHDADYMCV
jgi:hypothetical protein